VGAPTTLEVLAEWVASLSPEKVPAEQHELARLRVLDTLGLIAAGAVQAAGDSVAAWSGGVGEAGGQATNLATGGRCSEAVAALVHGTLAHARDFDDTFAESVVHPGSSVIPAALAVGEGRGATLEATATAIVAGYEVAARLGRVAGRGFHARGFHATSIVGPVAAAAAAGCLMKLDAGRIADAMGLATSMSSGTMAFLADGGWSKWLHTGWSAHGGVVAAGLAAHGFRGPRHALEHDQGLYGAFLGRVPEDGIAAITRGLGTEWAGASAQVKLYPCAHVIHPFIEAALVARRQVGQEVVRIDRVVCRIPPWAMPIVAEPRAARIAPRNDLEAIASLPFMVAAALCDGEVGLPTLRAECIARADIGAMAARIHCVGDASLVAGFDGSMEIVTREGAHHSLSATLPLADPQRVTAKLRANAALGGMHRVKEVEEALTRPGERVGEMMTLARLSRP
jgi:2-methylcitrate dehydratase PrpD